MAGVKNVCELMVAIEAEGRDWHDYGFPDSESLYSRVANLLNSNILSLSGYSLPFWKDIVVRLQENADLFDNDARDILSLLEEYPIERSIRKAKMKYYRSHFFELVATKIKAWIRRK